MTLRFKDLARYAAAGAALAAVLLAPGAEAQTKVRLATQFGISSSRSMARSSASTFRPTG